jgi:hypothetical protein
MRVIKLVPVEDIRYSFSVGTDEYGGEAEDGAGKVYGGSSEAMIITRARLIMIYT